MEEQKLEENLSSDEDAEESPAKGQLTQIHLIKNHSLYILKYILILFSIQKSERKNEKSSKNRNQKRGCEKK